MPKGIGIQQKDNQIIVAVVEDTGKKLVLAQLHCLTTENWQTDLTALFRRQRFDPYQVVASVSTQEAILRKFPVPFIQAKQGVPTPGIAAKPQTRAGLQVYRQV